MDGAVLEAVNAYYDEWMFGISGREKRFALDKIGFYNFGYWDAQATSQREASEALVDELVERIPDKGGRILTGPNLWGIVGRARAAMPGFPYSEAMKTHPGNWTFEELAKYLYDPKTDIPGNKMAFVGVKDNTDLADLLVYLRKLSDSPVPLPQ